MSIPKKLLTLIKLLIVMVFLVILAILIVPGLVFTDYAPWESSQSSVRVQINMIKSALDQHLLDTTRYPDSLEGLTKNTVNNPRWDGPYWKRDLPKDPWGNDYQYKKPGEEGRFGADGKLGGEKGDADVTSWEVKKK